jgi:hypothetical protein
VALRASPTSPRKARPDDRLRRNTKALGLIIPGSFLLRTDEVIE